MAPVAKRIEELRQTTTRAILNYEVWWAYKSSDTRPVYAQAMNRYPTFFTTAIHAHFVALLVALYSLYETRDDTHNIPQLLKHLHQESSITPEQIADWYADYEQIKPLWVKVSVLRNEAFGHRSANHDIDEVFRRAGVKPNELRDLIEGTKRLMNEISLAFDNSFHAFNAGAGEEVIEILQVLKGASGAA